MNRKDLFLLTIGIFFTAIAWLIADVYHASTQEKLKLKISTPVSNKYDIDGSILKILSEKNE